MKPSPFSCPHCSNPIRGIAFKGLKIIKECPTCYKKVRYKQPTAKEIRQATWKKSVIFLSLLTLYLAFLIALFRVDIPFTYLILPIMIYLVAVFQPAIIKLSSFEKDE
ncbi:dimethyl sulfoxide reductase [Neisseria sp. Marseille-Q5346]|uniref:dimethyl sulfoxide reductase n=1 Tax=unclassified Neisseria TaxID=2623750 RepID=UPI0021E01ABA|nr:dimethyl sulfoxide reductase [Neisseria sp. Marseille-Q5346]